MAPRRNVKISAPVQKAQSVPEKVGKGRLKKAKPSKVPGVITISFPVKENSLDVIDTEQTTKVNITIPIPDEGAKSQILKSPAKERVKNTTPVLRRGRSKTETAPDLYIKSDAATAVKGVLDTERKVDLKTKVALADEVARSQLLKEPIKARVNTKPSVPRRGIRGSKTEITSEFFNKRNTTTAWKVGRKLIVPTKKNTKKSAQQTPNMNTVATKKRKADSTEEKPTAKRRYETKANKKDKNELKVELSVENTTTKDDIVKYTDKNPVVKLYNTPMVVIPARRCRLLRGKKMNHDSQTKSASNHSNLVDELGKPQMELTNSAKSEVSYCKSPILQASSRIKPSQSDDKAKNVTQKYPRHTSISSVSNLSWTHDISSSSTTTCITVSSKDFVCFDNKLPVVNLKDIQKADISASDVETSCDQPISCVNSNSLIEINTLNLSSSSNNSFNNQIKDDKSKINKKDYTQAAKNLERALEKIDMEFINWIPESEHVSSDFNKLKDTLFHVLKSEFSALTHCRLLQEILANPKPDDKLAYINNKNKSEIGTEPVDRNSGVVGNNGIKKNILHDANIANNEIETESLEKHSDKNKDKNNVQTSEINENKSENSIEPEGDVTKSRTFESDKLSKRASLALSEDCSSKSENSLADIEAKSPHSLHDDDDALSLFAESITGIESSKLNTSTASATKRIEEYIPEPVQKKCVSPNYTYCPTKIGDYMQKNITKIVCEKQNADSTSIYREANSDSPVCNQTISGSNNYQQDFTSDSPKHRDDDNMFAKDESHTYKESTNAAINVDKQEISKFNSENHTINRPCLIADVYKLRPKSKQIIFKGVCFFNILQNCVNTKNNKMCTFLHYIPDAEEVTNILSTLNNELFIKEYMMIRRHEIMMRRYGICFVKVGAERQLTRLLVEMALDFIKCSHIDESLKVSVVEMTLMHLNNIDLGECEDLLKIKVRNGTLLCDVFMQIMTSSQNFSRFKLVFLSLTYFIVNNDRTFSLEVAEQILERICILPFDESLVRALLQIMRLTSREIFLNSMIVQFEKQISVNSDILGEYVSLKKDINFGNAGRWVENRPLLPIEPISPAHTATQQRFQPMTQPILMASEEQPLSELREGVPLPPSPDTTHLEILNKTSGDTNVPKITRTISGLNVSQYKPSVVFSPAASNSEQVNPSPKFQNWRNQSITQRLSGSLNRLMRPPSQLRPSHRQSNQWRDRRFVTLRDSPTKRHPPGANY